ncbi:N/A [soil metagenome]
MAESLHERWNAISLRTKMTGVSVFLLTLGLIVAGVGSATVLRSYLVTQVDQKISTVVQGLNPDAFTVASDGSCKIIAQTEYFVAIYSTSGQLLCSNAESNADHPSFASVTLTDAADSSAFTVPGSRSKSVQWRAIGGIAPFVSITGGTLVAVVAYSLADTDGLVSRYTAIFLFFGLTVVILGGAATRLLVTSTFAPLREVEATAARFASGDFNQRLSGATPNTEVGRLNRSLNAMLNRIDKLFADRARTIDQMRRFVGDASHELRTPLVSVRGYAELYRMGALPNEEAVAQAMERIEKEAIRMGELVADLLELARIDETKPLQLASVDLVALARDAALDAMASSPDRTVSVVVTDAASDVPDDAPAAPVPTSAVPTPATTTGRLALGAAVARLRRRPRPLVVDQTVIAVPQRIAPSSSKVVITAEENKIRQVITNLMGNALRFTPPSSPIELGVELDSERQVASVSVIDHGEGIPPQIREKIFQRFWRADTSRNRDTGGSGLGLAIVASIVSAHRGTIDVEETPGGGATFRVTLPVLQTPQESTPAPEA